MVSPLSPPFVRSMSAIVLLSYWSCASTPELDLILAESPRGTVYLERIPDRTVQVAHPIKVAPEILDRVLRGILIKEDQGLLRQLSTGPSNPVPAFTDEEVRFLAPLLAEGLSRAASDQQIGFRLSQSGGATFMQSAGAGVGSSEPLLQLSPLETTIGFLYADDRSLYMTLVEYRRREEHPNTIYLANRRVPDATGLANRTLSFTPESANRTDSSRDTHSPGTMLVIDFELVSTLPMEATGSISPSTQLPRAVTSERDSQVRDLQEQMRQKNIELEELRKELQDIRRQPIEPIPGSNSLTTKPKPSPNSR